MITRYGLFWSERDVFWGWQKKSGKLLGREGTLLRGQGDPTPAQIATFKDYRAYVGLYCLYGDGKLLYVGEAGLGTQSTLFTRLRSHRRGPLADRWDNFSWFGREDSEGQCDVKTALAQLEAAAIAIVNPGFNKQSGTFGKAVQVFQVAHKEAEGDTDTKLERLKRQMLDLTEQLAAGQPDPEEA